MVDLSHEIVDGMTTHPGIAPPAISTVLSFEDSAARYAPGTVFEIRKIEMMANTGTYLDTPAHRFPAALLVNRGAALVGIDSLNVDSLAEPSRPAHTAILAAGIPLVEHLTGLAALPATGFRFFAVPPRVRGMGTFPVRAFAIVE
jgi:kynurenine formamidase